MSIDPKLESSIDPDRMEQDNRLAFTKIHTMASDLWAIQEMEQRILTSESTETPGDYAAESADTGK